MNKPADLKTDVVPMWVNGRKQPAASTRSGEVTNPATGVVVRTVPFCNEADIDTAVQSAKAAFPGWRKTPALRRARVLMRYRDLIEQHRDELAALITEEHGKTLVDAAGSVQRGLEVVEFAMGIPHLMKGEHSEEVGTDVDSHSLREPLGVCAGITPFNFPGDGADVDVSGGDRVRQHVRAEAVGESAFDRDAAGGAFQGSGPARWRVERRARRQAGGRRAAHASGRARRSRSSARRRSRNTSTRPCAKHGKRVQALGGAKNHAVVLPDADLDFAADALIGAGYGSAGERCMAISAIVAVGEVGDALVEKLSEKAASLKIGPGAGKDMDMGPLVTSAHRREGRGLRGQGASPKARSSCSTGAT